MRNSRDQIGNQGFKVMFLISFSQNKYHHKIIKLKCHVQVKMSWWIHYHFAKGKSIFSSYKWLSLTLIHSPFSHLTFQHSISSNQGDPFIQRMFFASITRVIKLCYTNNYVSTTHIPWTCSIISPRL